MPLTAQAYFDHLQRRGIGLSLDNGRLIISGTVGEEGELLPHDLEILNAMTPDLVDLLQQPALVLMPTLKQGEPTT